jgi:hypothetical protein
VSIAEPIVAAIREGMRKARESGLIYTGADAITDAEGVQFEPGAPCVSISGAVSTLERRVAEYERLGVARAHMNLRSVAALHVMVHGPEDRNWCGTCNVQFPCATQDALWGVDR